MKFKSTMILLGLFVGLILYVYFYEVIGERKRTQETEEKKNIFHLKRDSVATITVDRPEIRMTFEKREKDWWIKEPVNYKADNSNVNSLLSQIEIADNEGVVSEKGEDLESFGLAPPQVKLYISLTSGKRDSLLIGNKNPVKNGVFARSSNSSEVFLTNYVMLDYMKKELMDYRDKTLLEFRRDYVNKIVLTYPNLVIELKEVGFNEWEIEKPIKDKAEYPEITSIFDKLLSEDTKIKKFIDEKPTDLNKYGLLKPAVKIDLFLEKDASKKSLMIGSIERSSSKKDVSKGEVLNYAKIEVNEPIIGIDSSVANLLLKKNLFIFRNKMVVDFLRDSVEKIVCDYKDSVFICLKDTANIWYFGEDKKVKGNDTAIEDIITKFRSIRALKFIDYNDGNISLYGLNKPKMEFIFKKRDDKEVERLGFGKIEGNKIYLINRTKRMIYLIDSEYFYDLKLRKSDLIKQEEKKV
jgi:hypothetical protein